MSQAAKVLVLGAALALAGAGCRSSDSRFDGAPGKYDGFLSRKQAGQGAEVFVRGTVTAPSRGKLSLQVKDAQGLESWSFAIEAESGGGVRVSAPALGAAELELKPESEQCFRSASGSGAGAPAFRLCYDGSELALDFSKDDSDDFLLVLDRHVDPVPQDQSTARPYTVDELVSQAKSQSFSSQEQFENAIQGRLNSLNAHLSLLPHVSANDILGLISFNWTSLIHMVGDLAPFLLPQNWFNAFAAHFQSDADYYAWLAMKADSGNIAEGLAYSVIRDTEVLARLSDYNDSIAFLRDQIAAQERLGLVAPRSSEVLGAVLDSLVQTENLLNQTITQEGHALALAVGLINPDAIASVAGAGTAAVESPASVDLESVRALAVERSPELRQMDDLLQAAHDSAIGRWFFWMDPSGGGVGLGPSAATYIELGQTPAASLTVQRQQLQATLLQKAEDAAAAMDTAVRSYASAKDILAIQKDRVEQIQASLHLGLAVSVTDLQLALQSELQAESSVIDAKYAYIVASGNLDRMVLRGRYLDILSLVTSGRPAPRP